eukprot:TRINITY_DN65562_c0_g1_i1.p1 TRINITY_DN65562_c0_g1~~TRINITY_DN65562_c0_g1_i1.p1  ORF type:complete len:1111 (+),score=151.42 TRINITY_DN65562_c0_g1_i1:22-3333(+)
MLFACCRKFRRNRKECCDSDAAAEIDDVEAQNVSSLIEQIGDSADPKTAQLVFSQILNVIDVALNERSQTSPRAPSTQDLISDVERVLVACGFRRGETGFTLPASANTQALLETSELLKCLLLSCQDDVSASATTTACDGDSGLPPIVAPPAGVPSAPKGSNGDAGSTEADRDDVADEGNSARGAPSIANPQDSGSTAAAGQDASNIGSQKELGASEASAKDAQGAKSQDHESQKSPEGAGTTMISDRELAERLAKEDEPKVVSFERFRAEDVVVDPAIVEDINRHCSQLGEPYVDPQFPPLPKSLYLLPWEADSWECSNCRSKTKLPALPPLPKTREEAQMQEELFKSQAICSTCGSSAPYVVQVQFFGRPTQWLRPGNTCQGCMMCYMHLQDGQNLSQQMCSHFLRDSLTNITIGSPWKVIREVARPEDVCQGGLGNCWLAAALSIVAQIPDLISKLFFTKEYNPNGVYHMQLCHAGVWRGIVLDDLFPTTQVAEGHMDGRMIYFSRGGTLCYLQAARRQLWVPLVEKAAAKLYGCYGSLKGGTFGEALALFTGYPTERVRLYVPKAVRQAKREQRDARRARRTQMLLRGMNVEGELSEDSDDDDDLTWSKLLSFKEAGYLMGMGCTAEGCEKTKHHIVEEMGLQAPHAYGILDLREATVGGSIARLVKIRNPWGERAPRTWKGDWGKDSKKWTPELQRELGVINSSGVQMDDPMSIFWMSFEDVKEYFSQIEVCRVHSDWHEIRHRAWLPSAVGAGEAFELTVFERTNLDIAFWQEKHISREGALGARSTNVDCGLAVLRKIGTLPSGQPRFELIAYFERAYHDVVSGEVILDGGYVYTIVPISFCQLLEDAPRCATLAVHSVHPVQVQKITSSWYNVASAFFEGAKRNGKQWNDRSHAGVTYYLLHEGGGCALAVENRSDRPYAVQADASESVGCVCSRGDLGAVIRVPAKSRMIAMVLAFSPGALYTRASILPQPVPLELAPAEEQLVSDLHRPLLVLPSSHGGVPPPDPAIMQRATRQAASSTQPAASGSAPSAATSARAARDETVARALSSGEEDEELAAALRLSLGVEGDRPAVGGALPQPPQGPLPQDEGKESS